MPTLDFKGKSFVYTRHLTVPFQELSVDAKKSELPRVRRRRWKKTSSFTATKFMGQKELTRLGVEFCQLPYAIHRIMGD